MIKINRNSNVHFTYPSGVTVSILISNGSYSDNHNGDIGTEQNQKEMISSTAEIGMWKQDGEFITNEWKGKYDVIGWQSAEEVRDALNWASKYTGGRNEKETD